MKSKGSNHLKTGALGEELAKVFLMKQGFRFLEHHYLRKWGEIDLILQKDNTIHFVEVKAVSYETRGLLQSSVSRGTYRPEENVHTAKLKRLGRAIQTWVAEKRYSGNFMTDVCTVRMVPREKYAVFEIINDVILE